MSKFLLKKSFRDRRLFLWGEVNDDMAASVIYQLHLHLEKDKSLPVHFLINSEGGSVDSCAAIIDEMEVAKAEGLVINTISVGLSASAAAAILAFGTKGHRYSRPNSTIMLHPISFGLDADYIEQQKKQTAFIAEKSIVFNKIIADAIGKDLKKYTKETKDGLWLTPNKALSYGVIDKIDSSPLPVYPNYKYD